MALAPLLKVSRFKDNSLMKKYLSSTSPASIVLLLVFLVGGLIYPGLAHANIITDALGSLVSFATDALLAPLGWVAILILQLMNLLLFIAGKILDMVIQFTVIDMRLNIGQATAIDRAWTTIRDLANMAFIFILLYAAIQTILGIGSNTKKIVVNIIIVAILINFSLFFTRIVIDASNILALFFYDAIVEPGVDGISDRMIDELELKSLLNTGEIGLLDGRKMIIIGFVGSILVLIAAFIFFAAALMFVARFVVLVLVLIFSPIAIMSLALPALRSTIFNKWWSALIGHAFFAPVYLMITWVVIMVSDGLFTPTNTTFSQAIIGVPANQQIGNEQLRAGNLTILMNFLIIGALLVASLIVSKFVSNKAGSGASNINKWALGAAGAASFGLVGAAGRNLIGGRAAAMTRNEELLKREARGDMSARLQLATARKFSGASFDVRGTKLGGGLDAGKAQKGGFAAEQKARIKEFEKYKPSKDAVKEAQDNRNLAKRKLSEAENVAEQRLRTIGKPLSLTVAEKRFRDAENELNKPITLVGISDQDKQTIQAQKQANVDAAKKQFNEENEKYERTVQKDIKTVTTAERDRYAQSIKSHREIVNRMENIAKRMEKQKSFLGGVFFASSKAKAAAVREAAKGKSKKEKFAEAAKEYAEELTPETEAPEPKPETPENNQATA